MYEALFNVFVRNWWTRNQAYPNGLEPCAGRKTYLRRGVSYADARAICELYNATHKPGRLSRKAEFEQCTR